MKIPSLLSYTRSINPSVGIFFAVPEISDVFDRKSRKAVQIKEVGLATTISNYSEDVDKLLANAGKNIQRTEMAIVPENCNFCCVEFSLNVYNNFKNANDCNNKEYRDQINNFVKKYLESDNIRSLSERYVANIITARFLFRNLTLSSKVKVFVEIDSNRYEFNVYSKIHDLRQLSEEEYKNAQIIIDAFTSALSGKEKQIAEGLKVQDILNLRVTAVFECFENSEIYPSQEFIEDSKGKKLSTIKNSNGIEQASFHAQKIGNAIRTIDVWYDDFGKEGYALPIEPYGIDRANSCAQRKDSSSLYKYLDKLERIDSNNPQQKDISNYIIACLIRGGVYSGPSTKKKE